MPWPDAGRRAGGVTWGRGAGFGPLPVAPARVNWFAGFDAPAGAPPADRLARVARRLAGWPPPVGDLLAATPADAVRADRIVIATAPRRWSIPRRWPGPTA